MAPRSNAAAVECVVHGPRSARTDFIVSQVEHLTRLTADVDDDTLRTLSHQPGTLSPLLTLLQQESARAWLREHDALAAARARGVVMQRALLDAEGGTLGAQEVATLLGLTRQAVDLRNAQGKLLAIDLGLRRKLYPRWQFTEASVLPGLEAVLGVLREGATPPWSCVRFFLSRNERLGGQRPLDRLRKNDIKPVLAAAAAFDQHGAA